MMKTDEIIRLNKHTYTLVAPLATGHAAFSELWRASDAQGNDVVLKSIKSTQPLYCEHLRREIQFLQQLKPNECPFIVPLLNHQDKEDRPVLVLPFMPFTLAAFIKNASQPIRLVQCLDWCLQITMALECVHSHQLHYRDLKPSNILTDTEGKALMLIDFGTIKTVDSRQEHSYSGTPSRMAPEQMIPVSRTAKANGEYDYQYASDTRTDFFGLGLLLFEMLTGLTQLTSQQDIQELREQQGAQGAWQQGQSLGGLNTREIHLFQTAVEAQSPAVSSANKETATFVLVTNNAETKNHPLTELLISLLAAKKEQRPQNCQAIIKSLTEIITPLAAAENDTIYAFHPDIPAPKRKPNKVYKIVGIAAFASVLIYPFIKPFIHSTLTPPTPKLKELPLDELSVLPEPIKVIATTPPVLEQPVMPAVQQADNAVVLKPVTVVKQVILTPSKTVIQKPDSDTQASAVATVPMKRHPINPLVVDKPITPAVQQADTIVVLKPKTAVKAETLTAVNVIPQKTEIPAPKPHIKPQQLALAEPPLPFQDMLIIAKAHFTMGNNQGFADEKPEHSVTINAFAVSQQLISNQQYYQYCLTTTRDCTLFKNNGTAPARYITKQQALDYIAHQPKKEGYTLRLLSEAEWEYLAIHKPDIQFEGLEWVADCASLNYHHVPPDSRPNYEKTGEVCTMGVARGAQQQRALTEADKHNRIPLPPHITKPNLGFRIAVSLKHHKRNNNE